MLFVSRPKFSYLACAACVLLALTGCSTGRLIPSVGQTVSMHMQGNVHGGQQPVVGAAIQLFDINSNGPNNGATPLIGASVLTDANGGFNITGDYTCPSGSDQVYLVATGGNPGGGTNTDLVMMTALGDCGSLTASTFIFVNEVTTVATVWAYANDYDNTQSGGANLVFFNGATEYQNFLNLVDPTTGVALTTNGAGVQLQLNALANSLATCVNSTTDVNGDSLACDALINDAGPNQPAEVNDSSEAVFAIAVDNTFSSANPMAVYADTSSSPPFQPTLSSAPSSWNLGFNPF